jgi:hypothetical protein
MCVIVHQPVGKSLSKDVASKLWNTNPDGGGFSYIDDNGNLATYKTMTFGDFWGKFEHARSTFPRRDFLLHMRIATHGSVSIENVHPFQVDEHTMMAHNGIIHGVTPFLDNKVDDRSDTKYFVEEVLPRLPETWLDDPFLSSMVSEWIDWSKLLFITTNPKLEYSVYRLGKFEEYEGLYLSNTNGLYTKKKVSGGYRVTSGKEKDTEAEIIDAIFSDYDSDWDNNLDAEPVSDEWKYWVEYRESMRLDQELDGYELDFLQDALVEERAATGIGHGFELMSEKPPVFRCDSCRMSISIDTAECFCWDLVCGEHWRFKANCDKGVCDGKDVYWYDNLSQEGKNKVLGSRETVVDKSVS